MKYLFWILFAGAFITTVFMRYHAKQSQVLDFNIMDFEYPADRDALDALISEWSGDPVKTKLLRTQLRADYIFMSLLFPAIFVLCFWARLRWLTRNNNGKFGTILGLCGGAQIVAWTFDLFENIRLEHWLENGGVDHIFLFKEMVFTKFAIGIIGFLLASGSLFFLAYKK